MGEIKSFTPVKLICGLIFSDDLIRERAQNILAEKFGPSDFQSQSFLFNFSHYYEQDMGQNLKRCFMSFETLIDPQDLSSIKHQTNKIEQNFKLLFPGLNRPVNLDPGYLKASALIMATTKDFAHRIPLTDGIYAHLELLLTKEKVRTLNWTYPDFYQSAYHNFFLQVRKIYLDQLKRLRAKQEL
ncbi:MAG TPA: DUF4416 family protein [Candidatus Saccharicenans sp.]|jgi:hypothetical protein|nr:DUF4416 family protein [Candidatus Saccharicenans sp.]HRD01139.1 DUF4416 family protein [Candidatus Saccharicenans sp.]